MKKDRSWTSEDLHDFFTLANHVDANLVIRPSGELVRILYQNEVAKIEAIIGDTSRLGLTESARYKSYLHKVKENPFGQWLFRHPDFRQAHALFNKKRQSIKITGYRIESAELRFLWCAAIVGHYILSKDSGNKRRYPNSRQIVQAINSIKKLQLGLTAGVRLGDYSKTEQLTRLLAELLEALQSTRRRKPRSDANSIDRECVASISLQLLVNFGEASPEIVIHLAGVLGYRAHETAIAAQIRTMRRKYLETKTAAKNGLR
ncbi:MAG: hypothetical protein ACKVQA_19175 [Burkholderiales bacterium]